MSNNTKKLIPKLRFPEFQEAGEWQPEILTKIFHFQDGFAFKSTDFIKCGEETIQVIRITDINNKNSNTDKVFASKNIIGTLKLEKYIVSDGDLLLSLTGAAGFNFFLWNGSAAVLNQRTCKITPQNKSNTSLARLLEPLIHEKINSKGEGQNNNLSKEFLNEIEIPVPAPKEQQKIADCLSSIDDLISAQSQKVEALKTHKKGLMQQLFPREGETVPRLRFPEFREDLKTISFSELGDIKIGLTHKPEYLKSGIPFLSSKNISDGYIDFENINYISEEKFLSMPDSTKPKTGDILFTRVGSNLGNPIILEEDREFGIFVSLGIFRVNKKAFNYYIKHWMDSDYFWKQLKQKVAGGAKDNLNSNWLREFTLAIPTLPEQQKIADCLSSIDHLITAQTQKLETLKIHKKGLMQQLFPSTEANELA